MAKKRRPQKQGGAAPHPPPAAAAAGLATSFKLTDQARRLRVAAVAARRGIDLKGIVPELLDAGLNAMDPDLTGGLEVPPRTMVCLQGIADLRGTSVRRAAELVIEDCAGSFLKDERRRQEQDPPKEG